MSETRSYGTWTNYGGGRFRTLDEDVREAVEGAVGVDVDAVIAAYREAINAELPKGVTLNGNEFYGPAHPGPDPWIGVPLNRDGWLDLAALVASVDLWKIVEAHTA